MKTISKSRTLLPLSLLAAVAATCLSAGAFAGAPDQPVRRSTQVSYADLDLANPAHVAKFEARIRRAARNMCQPEDVRNLLAASERSKCMQDSIASAGRKKDILVARAQETQMAARNGGRTQTAMAVD